MRACRTIKMRAVILIQAMIWCGCWLIQGLRHSTTNSITRRCRSFSTTHRLDRHHWMSCIVAGHSTRRNVSFSTITAATTSSSSSSSTSPTRYTIVCPPTDPDTLCSIVAKHQANVNRFWSNKPIAAHTKQAFQQVQDHVFGKAPGSRTVGSGRSSSNKNDSCPLILDSGCGTGRSSIRLGALYPNSIVLGVDKSLARLSRNNNNKFVADVVNDSQSEEHHHLVQQVAGNVWLVRAELVDFWRLLLLHRQQQQATESTAATTASSLLAKESSAMSPSSFLVPPVSQHYVLYPNPYPKKARLSSRWYAHPSFPLLLLLGGERIVFRSNWKQYLDELAQCVVFASGSNSIDTNEDEEDLGRFSQQDQHPVVSSTSSTATAPPTIIPFTAIQQAARYYRASALLGPVPLHAEERSGAAGAWTNFEEKYLCVGEPTFELVFDRRQHGRMNKATV